MTHPTTTLPADETSPTSPAPAPPWGNPTPRTRSGGSRGRAPVARKRPGWLRRNLTGIMAGTALVIIVAGLGLPAAVTWADPGSPGIGVKGPAGPRVTPASTARTARTARTPSPPQLPAAAPAEAAPAPEASGQSYSDGEYKVGVDIQPGEYTGKVEDQGEFSNGYWARLNKSRGIIDNGLVTKAGATMRLTVRSTDAYVEISGATFHKVG